jgi:hypothetical protein
VSGCGAVVRNGAVGIVKGAGVPSGNCVVVMGTIRVTTLHRREMGTGTPPPPRPARGCVILVGRFLEKGM